MPEQSCTMKKILIWWKPSPWTTWRISVIRKCFYTVTRITASQAGMCLPYSSTGIHPDNHHISYRQHQWSVRNWQSSLTAQLLNGPYLPSSQKEKRMTLRNTIVLSHFSHVWSFATLWTVTRQTPLSKARILEWVAISFSRGSSPPRDQTGVSEVSYIGRRVLYH